MYIIDQNAKTPLHIQLYEEIKKDIIENLQIGDKLPSIRKIATTYNLSKNTVESAYSQLYAEGYIESYPKSGYFVSETIQKDFKQESLVQTSLLDEKLIFKYDFFPARLSKDTFPLKLWKRLSNKVFDMNLDFTKYSDGQGEKGLREEICNYLTLSRGVVCHPDQIVICNGFSSSMGLLAKMLKEKKSTFSLENPGYHIARKVFEEYGYGIKRIPIDENGLKINELQKSRAKIVYITPSHQYPTGVTMPIANRLKLLEWAKENNGIIIEDDYDSELSYNNRPIPSLQGLDRDNSVVYIGTFAKAFSPAIRVSYMVLPNHLVKKYTTYHDAHFPQVPLMIQKTLELFIKKGHFERHIRKMRTLNRKKHNLMKQMLLKYLGNTVKIEVEGGGLSIFINPAVAFDMEKLKELALKNSIKLYFSSNTNGGEWEAIRMGFGGFKEAEIEEAVKAFSIIWKKSLV